MRAQFGGAAGKDFCQPTAKLCAALPEVRDEEH